MKIEARRAQASAAGCLGSLYIGGGTPSALDWEQLSKLFGILKEHFKFAEDAERTMEVNPGTVTEESLRFLLQQGINRLSIGVQSFADSVLQGLGRVHSALQAAETVRAAMAVGFRNVGVDLIHGIPGLTDAIWRETLEHAISLGPQHVSTYSLSLDEGSALSREAREGRFALPDDEAVAAQYISAVETLTGAGYEHYEISNFAKPGFACRHNGNYWDRGEYLGLGPAAWSFISGRRFVNVADLAEYNRRLCSGKSAVQDEETVSESQALSERLMLGLRRAEGVPLSTYEDIASEPGREAVLHKLKGHVEAGLLIVEGGRIRLTRRGMLLSNEVMTRLI